MSYAGWHPDPLARHELRYFDGEQWTPHVVDEDVVSFDPLATAPPEAGNAGEKVEPVDVRTTSASESGGSFRVSARTRRMRGLALIALLVLVVAAALGAVAFASSSKKTGNVHGRFTVRNAFGPARPGAGARRCAAGSAQLDVNPNTPVVIEDSRGTALARTQLGPGNVVGDTCVYRFSLAVESGSLYYVITVGNHRSTQYTFAQLQRPDAVALTDAGP